MVDSHLDSNLHLVLSKATALVSCATLFLSLWFDSVIMMQRNAREIKIKQMHSVSGIQAAGEARMPCSFQSSVIGCSRKERGSSNFSTSEGSSLQLSQVCNNALRQEIKSKRRERNGEKE